MSTTAAALIAGERERAMWASELGWKANWAGVLLGCEVRWVGYA